MVDGRGTANFRPASYVAGLVNRPLRPRQVRARAIREVDIADQRHGSFRFCPRATPWRGAPASKLTGNSCMHPATPHAQLVDF